MNNTLQTHAPAAVRGRVRYGIVALLFFVTAINYADRAILAVTGPLITKDLGISPVELGFVFSAFGWSYLVGQIPGGRLLDRYGSKRVYFWSILLWSAFTLLQGGVMHFGVAAAVYIMFGLRLLVGAAEAPSLPANARIVSAWFPTQERGTATAIFNSAQYFATVLFAPLMAWVAHALGWESTFYFMGALGIVGSLLWLAVMHSPDRHPSLGTAELEYIREGGGQTDMDAPCSAAAPAAGSAWSHARVLLGNRMMLGIYLGQYCISTLTYFFLTWFPVYLVQQRGMSILNAGLVASIPAIFGFAGGLLGGVFSDALLRRGHSLSVARKTPIVLGMLLSMSMVLCNYVQAEWLVVAIMALAFMGKGIGALGWAVMADTASPRIAGFSGGLFNMFGNVSSIVTPIAIGTIIQATGSFNGALLFISANAALAIFAYLVVVGEIRRVEA
ncbi:MFS transporter [Xylophilus sp.]|uniref:MFS transporter n=1 Tax=Xylophilus sp. TaxID=2653893 RepID=UPI0013B88B60|nr:MFS transporter [Xylophilus sp.]KAF1049224.1 MAG: putative glucarate transporter [Xylophilus sp.]